MINSKFNKNTVIFILLLLFLLFAFIYIANQNKKRDNLSNSEFERSAPLGYLPQGDKNNIQENCVTKIENRLVRGNSLSGLIEDGASVKILFDFYNCNEVMAGDIIIYNYSGDPEPLIKIVKAVPGDRFQLEQSPDGWNILVNGEILKNSQSRPYILDARGYKMLSLYENDYKGIIPTAAYLILGNLSNGSLDSSRFGLIDKSDILGKAVF
ncbi:MAG: signal peptidase I [bacterium]|nr:signal peptidase I [bacterium]